MVIKTIYDKLDHVWILKLESANHVSTGGRSHKKSPNIASISISAKLISQLP